MKRFFSKYHTEFILTLVVIFIPVAISTQPAITKASKIFFYYTSSVFHIADLPPVLNYTLFGILIGIIIGIPVTLIKLRVRKGQITKIVSPIILIVTVAAFYKVQSTATTLPMLNSESESQSANNNTIQNAQDDLATRENEGNISNESISEENSLREGKVSLQDKVKLSLKTEASNSSTTLEEVSLDKGDVIKIKRLVAGKDWCKIRVYESSGSGIGYVNKSKVLAAAITNSGDDQEIDKNQSINKETGLRKGKVAVQNNVRLSLKTKPSANSTTLEEVSLGKGEVIKIKRLVADKDWCKIRVYKSQGSGIGYVPSSKVLTAAIPASSNDNQTSSNSSLDKTKDEKEVPKGKQEAFIKEGEIGKLRTEPTYGSDVRTQIDEGEKVKVMSLSEDGIWCKVGLSSAFGRTVGYLPKNKIVYEKPDLDTDNEQDDEVANTEDQSSTTFNSDKGKESDAHLFTENFNGTIKTAQAYGITFDKSKNHFGAEFSRQKESRLEYSIGDEIPREGSLEFWIKIESGYDYNARDYPKLKKDLNNATIFTTVGPDTWRKGAAWLKVYNDGKIKFSASMQDGAGDKEKVIAKGTNFDFGEWHHIGISYGDEGKFIMLNGQVVASNNRATLKLALGGSYDRVSPTIGEIDPVDWDDDQHEGGFEGVLERFRVSNQQKDWSYKKGSVEDLKENTKSIDKNNQDVEKKNLTQKSKIANNQDVARKKSNDNPKNFYQQSFKNYKEKKGQHYFVGKWKVTKDIKNNKRLSNNSIYLFNKNKNGKYISSKGNKVKFKWNLPADKDELNLYFDSKYGHWNWLIKSLSSNKFVLIHNKKNRRVVIERVNSKNVTFEEKRSNKKNNLKGKWRVKKDVKYNNTQLNTVDGGYKSMDGAIYKFKGNQKGQFKYNYESNGPMNNIYGKSTTDKNVLFTWEVKNDNLILNINNSRKKFNWEIKKRTNKKLVIYNNRRDVKRVLLKRSDYN